jgi:integrase/recombinase XerD
MDVAREVGRFEEAVRYERGVQRSTSRLYARRVGHFLRWVDERGVGLEGVGRRDLMDYLDGQGWHSNTKRSAQQALRLWMRWRVTTGAADVDPAARWKAIPYRPTPMYIPTTGDVLRLILYWYGRYRRDQRVVSIRNAAIVALLAAAGLRRHEVGLLNCGDVRREPGHWVVSIPPTKSRAPGDVPFGDLSWDEDPVANVFGAWLVQVRARLKLTERAPLFPALGRGMGLREEARLSGVRVYAIVKDAAKGAGVSAQVTPHSLRHWFATTLLEQGVGIYTVSRLMRHGSMDTTAQYAGPAAARTGEIVRDGGVFRGTSAPKELRGWAQVARALG